MSALGQKQTSQHVALYPYARRSEGRGAIGQGFVPTEQDVLAGAWLVCGFEGPVKTGLLAPSRQQELVN